MFSLKKLRPKHIGGLIFTVAAALFPITGVAGSISICDANPGNLVQNCGFEVPAALRDAPPNWTTSQFLGGDDEIVTNPVNSGSWALEIANDENLPGLPLFNGAAIISQSFSDIAGATYQFTFYLFDGAGGNTSTQLFQAFWDNTSGTPIFTNAGGGNPALGFTQETFSVTGTGNDSVTFTAYNNPSFYYLDDVSVVETAGPPSAAPEPSSLMLFGAGALALAGMKWRKLS